MIRLADKLSNAGHDDTQGIAIPVLEGHLKPQVNTQTRSECAVVLESGLCLRAW